MVPTGAAWGLPDICTAPWAWKGQICHQVEERKEPALYTAHHLNVTPCLKSYPKRKLRSILVIVETQPSLFRGNLHLLAAGSSHQMHRANSNVVNLWDNKAVGCGGDVVPS